MKKLKSRLKLLAPYLFFAFLCVCLTPRPLQNDTFYLIKLGDRLWNSGADFKDHYTYLFDLYYSYPHFLFNLLCYAFYAAFGFLGEYFLAILLYFFFAASLFYVLKSTLKSSKTPFVKSYLPFLLTLLVVAMLIDFITARAQVLTYAIFLWELFFIEKLLTEKSASALKKSALFLGLGSWLVAINHATIWPFYFILFLPVLTELLLWKLLKNSSPLKNKSSLTSLKDKFFFSNEIKSLPKENKKFLGLSLFFSLLAGLLTPSRICYTAIFKIMSGNSQNYISEHAPLVLKFAPEAVVMLGIFLLVFLFLKSRLKLRDLFLFAGLSIMVFLATRNIALLLCLGALPLANLLDSASESINPKFFEGILRFTPKKLILLTISVLAVINFLTELDKPLLNPSIAPEGTVSFLKEYYSDSLENLDLNKARAVSLIKTPESSEDSKTLSFRLYNEYNIGAYLLFRDIPVSIDSRANIYTKPFSANLESDFFDDYQEMQSASPEGFELLEKYGFTTFLVYKENTLGKVLAHDPAYTELYSDDDFFIFEKNEKAEQAKNFGPLEPNT